MKVLLVLNVFILLWLRLQRRRGGLLTQKVEEVNERRRES